jgi:RNA polymerase sigma-70 factor (ECF subfamily)
MRRSVFHKEGAASAEARFEQHVLRARGKIFRLAYRILGNSSDAEDITQETFLRAWVNYASYDQGRSFESWVSRIAVNLCIDSKRRSRRLQTHASGTLDAGGIETDRGCSELADSSSDPAKRLQAREIDSDLLLGIRSLPVTHRHCMLLLTWQYTYREIAAVLGCPVGTVRSRVHRARAILREAIATPEGQAVFA